MAYNQGTGLTAAHCHAPEGRRGLGLTGAKCNAAQSSGATVENKYV